MVPGPEGTARGAPPDPSGRTMSPRPSLVPNGRHPSGADLCQQCGARATLQAAVGPDWASRRMRLFAICENCAPGEIAAAERWGRDLTITALGRRSLVEPQYDTFPLT